MISKEQLGQKDTSDWPSITENQWYALAITSAIFTAIAIFAAFLWIFVDGFDGDPDLKKAQALAPFGVALFAVVTFCTASWRGSINSRQANQAESEGRAKLLQEGAKLLSEHEKASARVGRRRNARCPNCGQRQNLCVPKYEPACGLHRRSYERQPRKPAQA